MNKYEAILFDFDGVIVDSEPIHFACWNQVLAPLGIRMEWEFYRKNFIGVSDRIMADTLITLADHPVTVEQVYAQYPAKTELFRAEMRLHLPFVPGVLEFVRNMEGYQIGVVTSSLSSEVAPVLIAGGLWERLSVVVFGEDVTRHKPDPEPYRKAAGILGITQALVVEDSDAGETSGRAAGFDVLRIPMPSQTVPMVKAHLGLE